MNRDRPRLWVTIVGREVDGLATDLDLSISWRPDADDNRVGILRHCYVFLAISNHRPVQPGCVVDHYGVSGLAAGRQDQLGTLLQRLGIVGNTRRITGSFRQLNGTRCLGWFLLAGR